MTSGISSGRRPTKQDYIDALETKNRELRQLTPEQTARMALDVQATIADNLALIDKLNKTPGHTLNVDNIGKGGKGGSKRTRCKRSRRRKTRCKRNFKH